MSTAPNLQMKFYFNPLICKKIEMDQQNTNVFPQQLKLSENSDIAVYEGYIPRTCVCPIVVGDFVTTTPTDRATRDNRARWYVYQLLLVFFHVRAKKYCGLINWFRPPESARLAKYAELNCWNPTGLIFFLIADVFCRFCSHQLN